MAEDERGYPIGDRRSAFLCLYGCLCEVDEHNAARGVNDGGASSKQHLSCMHTDDNHAPVARIRANGEPVIMFCVERNSLLLSQALTYIGSLIYM